MDRSRRPSIEPIDADPRTLRSRRRLYDVVTLSIVFVLGAATLDGLDLVDTVGVDVVTSSAAASDGTRLTVDHPSVTRPGLAGPLRVTVSGLDDGDPVRIRVDRRYLSIWDQNALTPTPDRQMSVDGGVVWEYESTGDEVVVELDGRLEPAVQSGRSGTIALVDAAGRALVEVDVATRVLP
ncbi:MAG: hypothetical protein KDB40_22660 [Acidimicrobiales bacterium]|nr:hypothetical protein [Acidimicrobiales bacterium]MCB9395521.1 hypothetical protein [Acidimicrobiaceae bacterium]